ncbi:MAG: serine O-acetyltransferase [Pseudochelatococcus sp.]|jgi:serine O-acetyltransferase|uniref:serine O-acetyltransferase n=1 Tax=Pseudochelatococcus sp. TaxID=2020869 RepID=UPI003D8EEB2C
MSAEARAARPQVTDWLWRKVRSEAQDVVRREPELSTVVYASILGHLTLEEALAYRIAQRLDRGMVSAELIRAAYIEALREDPDIKLAFRADLVAVIERDPAVGRYIDAMLYFKGFHAIEAHRLAHWLWKNGRRDFARHLQSVASEVFQTDIHPAVRLGRGIFLDHATGFVVGETAEIADNVSILQGVTLGGTGKGLGDRHPKVRSGVLIGAGAKILGNIEVGERARVGAGAVVLSSVPPRTTVAGSPARVVGSAGADEPSQAMNQMFYDVGL